MSSHYDNWTSDVKQTCDMCSHTVVLCCTSINDMWWSGVQVRDLHASVGWMVSWEKEGFNIPSALLQVGRLKCHFCTSKNFNFSFFLLYLYALYIFKWKGQVWTFPFSTNIIDHVCSFCYSAFRVVGPVLWLQSFKLVQRCSRFFKYFERKFVSQIL